MEVKSENFEYIADIINGIPNKLTDFTYLGEREFQNIS